MCVISFYTDPKRLIDHIADLKRKTALAEEQLHILQVEVTWYCLPKEWRCMSIKSVQHCLKSKYADQLSGDDRHEESRLYVQPFGAVRPLYISK